MNKMAKNKVFNIVLLFVIIGEFLIPRILQHFYPKYDSKTMVMSVLGNSQSPVRLFYNIWLIILGCFLIFTSAVYYYDAKEISLISSILIMLSIAIFAVGAGLLSGMFSVDEVKGVNTVSSKVHGISAAIGFMALLFFPLLNGILAFKQRNLRLGMVCIVAFVLAFISFIFFVIGDKQQFQNTIFSYEGLWERVTLFCMYVPFAYKAISSLLF